MITNQGLKKLQVFKKNVVFYDFFTNHNVPIERRCRYMIVLRGGLCSQKDMIIG